MNEKTPSQTPDDQPPQAAGEAPAEATAPPAPKAGQPAGTRIDEPASDRDRPGGPGRPDEPSPPAPEATAQAKPGDRRPGRGLAILALFLALLATAGSAYLYRNQQQALVGVDRSRADLDATASRLEAGNRQLAAGLERLERGVADMQAGQAASSERLSRQRARIDGLEEELARLARSRETVGSQLRREQVQHLLRIANYQLNLGRDPVTALAALREADGVLAKLADPGLQPLRRQLSDDILALRSVERVDVEGVALRLESLARRVDQLPLNAAAAELTGSAPDAAAEGGWARFRQKVSEFLSSIFTVRRTESSTGPLLSREESFFLRRNLELELQAARIALLAGDTEVFSSSLAAARRWTEEYFDRESAAVETFIGGLSELSEVTLQTRLPDISGSLRTFLDLQEQESRQRPGPEPAPAGDSGTPPPAPPPAETPAGEQAGQT
jgi:uncharacterized protein HemX